MLTISWVILSLCVCFSVECKHTESIKTRWGILLSVSALKTLQQTSPNSKTFPPLSLSSSSPPYSDVTGATWGGSTVQSELEDPDTTASTISGHILDTTQESIDPTVPGASASLEQPGTAGERIKFSVTRHTPRLPARTRPHVRVDLSPSDEQNGKRIKLDNDESNQPLPKKTGK